MTVEFSENHRGEAAKRHTAPRPAIRLFIPKGSPLAEGRLPEQKQEVEGGWVVKFDPISLAALLTSVGKSCGVQQASEEMPGLVPSDQQPTNVDEKSPGEAP